MTTQVIVALDKAYAAKRGGGTIAGFHELHLLDTGAIAILDEENNIVQTTTTLASLNKVQKFYIAQGNVTQASTPKVSIAIDRNAATQWFNSYAAPVLMATRIGKVATVGTWGFPGTFLDGTYAQVNVMNRPAIGYTPNQVRRYPVQVFSTDSNTTVINRLRDAINADPSAIVTATSVIAGGDEYLQLTAKNVGTVFTVGVDELAVNATINAHGTGGSTDAFGGFGTLEKVKTALGEDKLTRGDEYRTMYRAMPDGPGFFSYPDVLDGVGSGTFDGWTFQWKEEAQRAVDVIQTATPTVALFMISAGTGNANITTIINLLLSLPDTNSGGSSSGVSSGEGTTVTTIPAGGEG